MEFINLPTDALLEIASWLDGDSVLRLTCTCKTLAFILEDNWLWERIISKLPPEFTPDKEISLSSRTSKWKYFNVYRKNVYLISSPNSIETRFLKCIINPPYRRVTQPSETTTVLVNVNRHSIKKYFGGRAKLKSRIEKLLEDGIPVIFLNCRIGKLLVMGPNGEIANDYLPYPDEKFKIDEFRMKSTRDEYLNCWVPHGNRVVVNGKNYLFFWPTGTLRTPLLIFIHNIIAYHSQGKIQIFSKELIELIMDKCHDWNLTK